MFVIIQKSVKRADKLLMPPSPNEPPTCLIADVTSNIIPRNGWLPMIDKISVKDTTETRSDRGEEKGMVSGLSFCFHSF